MKFIRKFPIYENYLDNSIEKHEIMKKSLDSVQYIVEDILFKYLISPEWFVGKLGKETSIHPGESSNGDYIRWNNIATTSRDKKLEYLRHVIKYNLFIEDNQYVVGIPMTTEKTIVFKGNSLFDHIDLLEKELREKTNLKFVVRLKFERGKFATAIGQNINCLDIYQNVNINKLCNFLSRFIRLDQYYGNIRLRIWNRTKHMDLTELIPISQYFKFKDICVIVTRLYAKNKPQLEEFFNNFSLDGAQDILVNSSSSKACVYISDLFSEKVVEDSPVSAVRCPNNADIFTPVYSL